MLAGIPIVLLWVLVGWPLCTMTGESNLYVLLGVPIVLLFQRFVRKRPLRELWLGARSEAPAAPVHGGSAIPWTIALAAVPVAAVVYSILRNEPASALYGFLAAVGAVPLAYALRRVRAQDVPALLRHAALPVAVGMGLLVVAAIFGRSRVDQSTPRALLVLLTSFAIYAPAVCLVEEPFFRGALDAHATRPKKTQPDGPSRDRWPSAIWVAVLWGIWNLPTLPPRLLFRGDFSDFLVAVGSTFVFHAVLGVFLSLARRRSATLVVPVFAHALVDATRVALGITI